MTTDSELLRRYVDSGSQEAFREVVCRHIHVIYFTALRRTGGQTQLAEEVVQDVFSALAANAARLSGYSSLVGWLFVATRFAASKTLRREGRRSRREQEVYCMQYDDRGGELAAETWQQIRPAVDGLLDDLPDRDRTAVLLRFFENRSFAELGVTALDASTRDAERGMDLVMLRLKLAAQPLFARWGIGPEKHDEVIRLVSEPARIKKDAVELAKAEFQKGTWSRENDAKLGETTQRAVQETMQKVGELVGQDHLQELMKLVASLGEHELASRIAGDVAFTDAPLSFSSGQSLVQILQQTRYSPANYQSTPMGGAIVTAEAARAAKSLLNEQGLGTLPLVTDATIAKANDVLAPIQVAALRRLQTQQLALIKMAHDANAVAGR